MPEYGSKKIGRAIKKAVKAHPAYDPARKAGRAVKKAVKAGAPKWKQTVPGPLGIIAEAFGARAKPKKLPKLARLDPAKYKPIKPMVGRIKKKPSQATLDADRKRSRRTGAR